MRWIFHFFKKNAWVVKASTKNLTFLLSEVLLLQPQWREGKNHSVNTKTSKMYRFVMGFFKTKASTHTSYNFYGTLDNLLSGQVSAGYGTSKCKRLSFYSFLQFSFVHDSYKPLCTKMAIIFVLPGEKNKNIFQGALWTMLITEIIKCDLFIFSMNFGGKKYLDKFKMSPMREQNENWHCTDTVLIFKRNLPK